jgi:NADH:ubiquinone oxidoreductase subunit 6 (subunit J)
MNILSAYVVTCSIITYRWWTRAKQLPPPLAYAGATAVFGGIGIMAKSEEAEKFAGVLAWGIVIGALAAPAANISAVNGIFGVPSNNTPSNPEANVQQSTNQTTKQIGRVPGMR